MPVEKIKFISCPIESSLNVLGKKWTFLIIRNIGIYNKKRFSEMLKITPGLPNRILSLRLKELEKEGFIEQHMTQDYQYWELTEKGKDVLPILIALIQFGTKWYASAVFRDQKPRVLRDKILMDLFSESFIYKIMSNMENTPYMEPLA